MLLLRCVLAVFGDRPRVAAVAILSSVHAVLLRVGCIDAVERAILAAGVGAVGPRAGGVGAVCLAGGYGVVRLVVAVLRVDAIAAAVVVVVAAAARAVAHALLRAVVVGVGAAVVVVVAVTALGVTVGFVT